MTVSNILGKFTNLYCYVVSQCMSRKAVDVHWLFDTPKNPHAGGESY